MNKALFMSNKDAWRTPQALYEQLNALYDFVLDAAASDENHKAQIYFTKEQDALKQSWDFGGSVFCNPPYGKDIARWVLKAYHESTKGVTVVMLLPARTDTKWFHDLVLKNYAQIIWIKGRLKFEDENGKPGDSAPFPSMIVVFWGARK